MTCPRCGAPLPLPGEDGFATCGYCGVRTALVRSSPPEPARIPPDWEDYGREPPLTTDEDDVPWRNRYTPIRVGFAIVVIIVTLAVVAYASSQPSISTPAGAAVAHCSVAINASATTGPAPFTASFTAELTTPPGVSTGEPMWKFGPFPAGPDLNFTYGATVSHTWDTNGSYGVIVSVPDSTGQGCWSSMNVDVT